VLALSNEKKNVTVQPLEKIDQWIHSFRSFVLPGHYASYVKLKNLPTSPQNYRGPYACYDFTSTAIDNVMGRYLFHLVSDFLQLGYTPVYRDRFRFLATMYHKEYKKRLLDLPFATYHDLRQIPGPYLLVTDNNRAAPQEALKTIRIDYTERRPFKPSEVALPFFVHPNVQSQHNFPPQANLTATRPVRLFFGGNTTVDKYSGGPVQHKYRMLPRTQVVDHVRSQLAPSNIHVPTSKAQLDKLEPVIFLCAETQHFRIPFETWLVTMKQADFFLACPGASMPLCHNLVEALSCGTIPILQYHHYMNPALEHGKNCLTYRDHDSLAKTIQLAIAMPHNQILTLRQGAYDYYQQNLPVGCLTEKLLRKPSREVTLLFNAYRVPLAA
jgi:hypothetical protein